MKMYMAKVRLSSAQLIEMEVIANTPHEAKQLLEMQFGEGNVVYYPREII
jgi:hypothetical protein